MGDSHLSAVELVGATSGQHYPLFNDFDEFYPDDVAAPDRSGLSTLMACDPDWGWVQDNQEVVVSAALHLLESLTADGEYGIGEWVACEFRVASTRFVLATRKKQQSAFGAVALFETVPADRPTRSGEPKLAVGAGLRTSHSWNGIVAANDRGSDSSVT